MYRNKLGRPPKEKSTGGRPPKGLEGQTANFPICVVNLLNNEGVTIFNGFYLVCNGKRTERKPVPQDRAESFHLPYPSQYCARCKGQLGTEYYKRMDGADIKEASFHLVNKLCAILYIFFSYNRIL